jgi:hypothetical protein
MYCNAFDFDFLSWSIFFVHFHCLHLHQSGHTIVSKDMAKHSVLAIQMGCFIEADKKLTTVGRRSFVCHADYAPRIMSEGQSNLVFERFLPNRHTPFWLRWRGSSLNHELRYESMKKRSIVIIGCTESKKILEQSGLLSSKRRNLTSAVLGTLSQNTSSLMSPRFVCRVTDMMAREYKL